MYPAHPAVLPAVLMLTAFTVVAGFIPVVGILFAIAATLTAYKFAFEILQHHANGWEEPPEAMINIRSGLVFQYLVVLLFAGIICWLTQKFFGTPAGILVLALVSLIQPAYTLLAAIEGSALLALHPGKWLRLMRILGNGYFLLSLLMFSGQLMENWLGNHVFSLMPGFLASALIKIIGLWILFTSARWMGYLIYAFHRDLGHEPSAHRDQAIRGFDRDDILIKAIDTAMNKEEYDACIEQVKYESRERVLGINVHAKYRDLLVKRGNALEIRQHAQTFLHQLLIEKNLSRSLLLAIQQFSLDPDFVPLDGETADALVKEACRTGQHGLEKKLLISLLSNFPHEAATADWAIRLNELLIQTAEPNAQALCLLDAAIKATRSETQRQLLGSARQTITAI